MATLIRLPVELTNMVAANLKSPKDLLSWISIDPTVLQKLLENKSAVFESFIDSDLLPLALGVLRLREFHQQSTALPSVGELVESASKSTAAAQGNTPSLLWPTDKASALALLELMGEVECIATAMQDHRCRDDVMFWPSIPWLHEHPEIPQFDAYGSPITRPLQHNSFWDKNDEKSMFIQQKHVLLFEIYVLSFCYGRAFTDYAERGTPLDSLSDAIEHDISTQLDIRASDFGEQLDGLSSCLCSRCDAIIDSALRQVSNICQVDGQSFSGSDVVLHEGVKTLQEALGTQKVMFHSARWSYDREDLIWTRSGIESMTGVEARRLLRPSQVGWLRTGQDQVPIYRIACVGGGEYIVKVEDDGVTVVAHLETLQEQQNWDVIDGIHNAWKLVSGGIGRLAFLLRLDEDERRAEVTATLSRANSDTRSALEKFPYPRRWYRLSFVTWITENYPGWQV